MFWRERALIVTHKLGTTFELVLRRLTRRIAGRSYSNFQAVLLNNFLLGSSEYLLPGRQHLSAHLITMVPGETQSGRDPAIQISTTVRILKKRPSRATGTSHGTLKRPRRDVKPLREALEHLGARLALEQRQLQRTALEQIVAALDRPCPRGQFPAVCIHTGTSAAAGDSSTFDAALQYILDESGGRVRIVSLHPSRHDSLRAVADAVTQRGGGRGGGRKRLVVAVEHAHLFHPDLLSDLIYLLVNKSTTATTAAQTSNCPSTPYSAPPIAAVFAVPHANALHECLNVRDASALATTLVRMPSQHEAFDAVIHALSDRSGVLFTSEVFHTIERHFFTQDTSLAMLTRTLRQMMTLHYSRTRLADFLLSVDELNSSTLSPDSSVRARDCVKSVLKDKDTLALMDDLVSTSPSSASTAGSDDERAERYLSCLEALSNWKRTVCALETLVLKLEGRSRADHDEASGDGQTPQAIAMSPSRRAAVFRQFLPEDEGRNAPGVRCLASLLKSMKIAPRAELARMLATIESEIRTFPFPADQVAANANEELSAHVRDLIAQLNARPSVASMSTDPNASAIVAAAATAPSPATPGRVRRATGAAAAQERRRQALHASVQQAQQAGPLSKVHDSVEALLRQLFSYASPLRALECHELVLFRDVDALSRSMGGLCRGAEPRCAVLNALRQPSMVLGRPLPSHKVPDTSVAFRILAEGGRLVSLYDWYNTFASMRSAASMTQDTANTEPRVISSAELQARFARACSELELVGLIKYTNRKTDHVARLAFE